MDTLCLDVKRLASVYCGTGAIRTESSRWRYHRLPVVWCFNFSLKRRRDPFCRFSSLNSASRWGEAELREERYARKDPFPCRLRLKYHRLKSVVYSTHINARSAAASKIPSASHRHVRYSYLGNDHRGRAGDRNQRVDSPDLRSSIRPRECAPHSDALCPATSHSGLGPSRLADDCVTPDRFYGSQGHCRILLYLVDGLHGL